MDNEYYDVQAKYLRPTETTEISKYNVYDDTINSFLKNKTNGFNESDHQTNLFTQESFIGQYIVDNHLLTSDELTKLMKTFDNKEMSALFDIAEDMIITINDLTDVLAEEADAMSIAAMKAASNTLDELKEKTSSLLINAVDSWKKQMLA
jgi:hypothetical protein